MGITARSKAQRRRTLGGSRTVRRPRRWRSCTAAAAFAVATVGLGQATLATAGAQATEGGFNARGNILIADQFNNRIIEINRDQPRPSSRLAVRQRFVGCGSAFDCWS